MERTFGKGKEQEKEAISTSWTLCQTAWEVSDSHVRLLFIDLMPWHYCTQSWRFHVKWNRWRYTDTWSTLKHWPIKYCGRGLGTGEQWEWGVPWWGNKYCGEWSEGQWYAPSWQSLDVAWKWGPHFLLQAWHNSQDWATNSFWLPWTIWLCLNLRNTHLGQWQTEMLGSFLCSGCL